MSANQSSEELQGSDESQTSRRNRTEEDVVEELILDYACKNNMQRVISEIFLNRDDAWYQTLDIPHLRFIASTLHSIIHKDSVSNYEEALRHLYILHDAKSDLTSNKRFVKLTAAIKAKVILSKLETTFDYAIVCAKLNQFFPKAELHAKGVSQEQARLNNYQLTLRRKLTRLIVSPPERQAYQESIETHEFGQALTNSMKDLVADYCEKFNENLKVPVIEQIASEGPQSQISRDVQDSPTTCMDHLLSVCFRGLPNEDQLLHLLTLTQEERCKSTADKTDHVGMLSSSSSDEAGQGRSTRSRSRASKQGTSRTESAPSQRTSHHDENKSNPQRETPKSTRSRRNANSSTVAKEQAASTKSEQPNSTKTSTHSVSTPEKQHHGPVHTPRRTSRQTTSQSKIYFSTAMKRVTQSQPTTQPTNIHHIDGNCQSKVLEQSTSSFHKAGPSAIPCGTSKGAGSSKVVESQGNSESSGSSSSQSTISVSLLPSSRAKLIAGKTQETQEERITDVLVEEEEEKEDKEPSVEYTGSVTVIEETPSLGEVVEASSQVDQCNTVSSSGSSSAPSQPSQNKEALNISGNSDELQDSNVSSVFDSPSVIFPSPEAETANRNTFIRTPVITTQDSSCDLPGPSVEMLSSKSDDEDINSVVSDSEASYSSDADSSSEAYFTPSEHPMRRRRIPSLTEYLTSPSKPSSTDVPWDGVPVIRPCKVVLQNLGMEEGDKILLVRRSTRRRQVHVPPQMEESAAQDQPPPNADFVCTDCQQRCGSHIGLLNHRRMHITPKPRMSLREKRSVEYF